MGILKTLSDALSGKATLTEKRSPKWDKVRTDFLKTHPYCSCCGGETKLEVHHIKPFNVHPELELDPKNLITLCEASSGGVTCHLFFGHLGDYKSWNEAVVKDATSWNKKLKNKPKKVVLA
jgi:5-methylcytosine-specific restriction enzyme A